MLSSCLSISLELLLRCLVCKLFQAKFSITYRYVSLLLGTLLHSRLTISKRSGSTKCYEDRISSHTVSRERFLAQKKDESPINIGEKAPLMASEFQKSVKIRSLILIWRLNHVVLSIWSLKNVNTQQTLMMMVKTRKMRF